MSLKDLYNQNVNIMEYFRKTNNTDNNSINAILASYDLQAGSYIKGYQANKKSNNYHINGKQTQLLAQDFIDKYVSYLADEINALKYENILEAGVGEATTLSPLMDKLENKNAKIYGFDLAPSRIKQAKKFCKKHNKNCELFVANLLKTPFKDNCFDVIYTCHALEPNTNELENIIKELYRITKKYLILIEPSYELGNAQTKANIKKHKYITNLKNTAQNLLKSFGGGGKIIKYDLYPIGTFSNQSAIMIIEKNQQENFNSELGFACPVCHESLILKHKNYFCKECLLVYPVIKNIPCLTKENAILFSQYL